jgi:hypothetical protein
MSGPRPDGPFEVPVRGLAGGRSEGRRGIVVAVAMVAVLGGAFAIARLSGPDRDTGTTAASDDPLALASPAASARPAASGPAPRRSTAPRVEVVLDVPNRAIPGAPDIAFSRLVAGDLQFAEWRPGDELVATGSVPDVLGTGETVVIPIVAPTGTRQSIILPIVAGGPSPGPGRIVNGLGRTIWSGSELAADSGGLWSADGTLAVLAGAGRRWHLVSIEGSGSTREAAVETVVELPGEVFLPLPIPNGSITIPRVAPRTIPVGFSADGRWIYGGVVSPELGIVIGEFRVRVDGGLVERVSGFGVGRADGLAPRPGTLGSRLVDPVTGRIANWRVNPDTTGGPPRLEIREADKSFAFTVDVPALLGSAWGGDGSLYVLSADAPLFPNVVTLARMDADGAVGPPLLETGPVAGGSLIDVRGGFAAIILWARGEDARGALASAQVVTVDLANPARVSALSLPVNGALIVGAELRLSTGAP